MPNMKSLSFTVQKLKRMLKLTKYKQNQEINDGYSKLTNDGRMCKLTKACKIEKLPRGIPG